MKKNYNLREFVLITLTHAERRDVTKEKIIERVMKSFLWRTIVIAKARKKDSITT